MDSNIKIAKELVRLAKSLSAENENALTDDEIKKINQCVEVPFATTESSFSRETDNSCKLDMNFVVQENYPFGNMPKDDFVLITKKDGQFIAKLFWFLDGKPQTVDITTTSTIEELGNKFDSKTVTRTFGSIYDPNGLDTRW